MSQMEQSFNTFLSKHPEIEKCYTLGLINRRALARYLIKDGVAQKNQLEAAIAMIRRHDFAKFGKPDFGLFKDKKTSIKDNLTIFNVKKTQKILNELDRITRETDFTSAETLKIIVGTTNVTIIIDSKKKELKKHIESFEIIHSLDNVSELSIQMPEKAIDTKGIISAVARELFLRDILISEFITASNELSIYLKEEYILDAYKTVKEFF